MGRVASPSGALLTHRKRIRNAGIEQDHGHVGAKHEEELEERPFPHWEVFESWPYVTRQKGPAREILEMLIRRQDYPVVVLHKWHGARTVYYPHATAGERVEFTGEPEREGW